MTQRSRLGAPGLLARHFTSGVSASLLVALLIAVVVLVVALAPRTLTALSTAELRYRLNTVPAFALDLHATGPMGILPTVQTTSANALFGDLNSAVSDLGDQPAPLGSLLGDPHWVASTPSILGTPPVVEPGDPALFFNLAVDLDYASRITFIQGSEPAPWKGSDTRPIPGAAPAPDAGPLDIAISSSAATAMGLTVGEVLDADVAPLRIAGIYEPTDPSDRYWSHVPSLQAATSTTASSGGTPLLSTWVFVDPATSLGLRDAVSHGQVTMWVPVLGGQLDIADAPEVAAQAREVRGAGFQQPGGQFLPLETRLVDEIDGVTERTTTLSALIALSASGPLGVALAVFALGVQSVIGRRRAALTLASARGASGMQLRGAMVLEGLVLSVPVSAVVIGVATLLLPVRGGPEALILPAIVALAVPVLFAVSTSAGRFRATRSDVAVGSRSRWRWVIEAAVVGIAALSLFLLAQRGLVESSEAVGIDPLLVAAPLLLASAGCVLALRVYPFPLLALQVRMRARRGAIGLLGVARAIREPALGFAATLALVVGVSVAVFSAVMSTTVGTALTTTAREEVGADIRVEAVNLSPAVIDELTALTGISEAAPLSYVYRRALGDGAAEQDVTVVFADIAMLREVHPGIPAGLATRVGTAIPVVLSADLVAATEAKTTLEGNPAVVVGTLPVTAIPGLNRAWVLVDSSFAAAFDETLDSPKQVLLGLDRGADPARVVAAVNSAVIDAQPAANRDDVVVADVASTLAAARSGPLVAGLEAAQLISLLLSIALCAITVALSSVAAAARRNRTIGVLRTLGMSPRQSGKLVAWEVAPVGITAAVAGTALGLGLPWLVTRALDLRPFVGGTVAPTPTVDVLSIAALLGAFAAVIAITTAAATIIGGRRHPAATVKMGAE